MSSDNNEYNIKRAQTIFTAFKKGSIQINVSGSATEYGIKQIDYEIFSDPTKIKIVNNFENNKDVTQEVSLYIYKLVIRADKNDEEAFKDAVQYPRNLYYDAMKEINKKFVKFNVNIRVANLNRPEHADALKIEFK